MAHIGVIKALEEHHIPIDYITGTSMGAIIGGLYASGYSVEELERLVADPAFLLAINGDLPEEYVYYFSKDMEDASLIRLKLATQNFLQKAIPANLVTPDLMEYQLMELTAQASAVAKYDFDRLMIPFRCVAADVANKELVTFANGNLALALRASSTYPFYFKPLRVDGRLLFDGGLYNNFPADVMYMEFLPDVIIGSNVASAYPPPEEDDLLSQVRSMIVTQSNFELMCEYGVIIEPKSEIGVFDFSDPGKEIQKGYDEAVKHLEVLYSFIDRRDSSDARQLRRESFRARFPAKEIGQVKALGDLNNNQRDYIESRFGTIKPGVTYDFEHFKSQFLRVTQDDKVRHMHPLAQYNDSLALFNVSLNVTRERDLTAYFGGNFSSRPINMGYIGLKYNLFGFPSASLLANSYFGRFYGSALLQAKIDFGGVRRYYLKPYVILNRWDYFRNFSTFFEQSRPSFTVKSEAFGGITGAASWGSNALIKADVSIGETLDRYYQTQVFTAEDTADATRFRLSAFALSVDRNTLNRKQYASRGTRLEATVRAIQGREKTEYGTTIPQIDSVLTSKHQWAELRLRYENYFLKIGRFTFGGELEGIYSLKPNFDNYSATVISAPFWTPIPESKTLFIEEHRSLQFLAGGLKGIYQFRKNMELRVEAYGMQPFAVFERLEVNGVNLIRSTDMRYYIGAAALVYHSPLGPLSLNLNYYSNNSNRPWSFLFNFGYTIFNRSVYQH